MRDSGARCFIPEAALAGEAARLAADGTLGRIITLVVRGGTTGEAARILPPRSTRRLPSRMFVGRGDRHALRPAGTPDSATSLAVRWFENYGGTEGNGVTVGWLDEDGFLHLSDRRTHLIISGGVNVYPRASEDALGLHPLVGDVGVVGVPDPEFGEQVKAVVQSRDPAMAGDEAERTPIEFCRGRLNHMCP